MVKNEKNRPKIELYIDNQTIISKINELAKQINDDYGDKNPVFVIVLKGAAMFGTMLFYQFKKSAEIEFVTVKSYEGMESTGNFDTNFTLTNSVENRHVIIVEDIVDSGLTLDILIAHFNTLNCASLEVVTLLQKPQNNQSNFPIKYIGFNINNTFVLGFGMDLNEEGRNLNHIYAVKHN
jgi:hypoxanthine phosphoribosyltransferase